MLRWKNYNALYLLSIEKIFVLSIICRECKVEDEKIFKEGRTN